MIIGMEKEFESSGKDGFPIWKVVKIVAPKFKIFESVANLIGEGSWGGRGACTQDERMDGWRVGRFKPVS